VVLPGGVVSRKPDDLSAFCEQLVTVFQQKSLPASAR
jgi:hypothetical protein